MKNVQVQLMTFYLIHVETIRKYKNVKKDSHLKSFTCPANDFLLQPVGEDEKKLFKKKMYKSS